MKQLNRKQIVEKTHGYKTEKVDIPEWDGFVYVRELTAPEVTKVGLSSVDPEEGVVSKTVIALEAMMDVIPQIVAWAVVDEDLNPVLSLEDVQGMTGENLPVIQMLGYKALELSGLTEDTEEEEDGEPESKN